MTGNTLLTEEQMGESEITTGFVDIMQSFWKPLPAMKQGELKDVAAELLRKFQKRDTQLAIERFLAQAQIKLWVDAPNAHKHIAYRASELFKKSN
jgi:hypothetical protein